MPAELVSKQTRQDLILDIIKGREVHNQLELIRLLEERGVTATQSSVSRDIHELSIAKVDSRYMVAILPSYDTEITTVAGGPLIREIRTAGENLTIVESRPGGGSELTRAVRGARWPEVLGVVSDADTVFFATAGRRELMRLVTRLEQFAAENALIDSDTNEVAPDHYDPRVTDHPRAVRSGSPSIL